MLLRVHRQASDGDGRSLARLRILETMPTRRDFLRLSAMAAAAGCILKLPEAASASDTHLLYGVQLYTVHREAATDLPGVLRALRQIGFTQIELHPVAFKQPAATLRQIVVDAGLTVPATHMSAADLDTRIEYARQLGVHYLVTMLPNPRPVSLEEYRAVATRFNGWGASVRDQGMELAYLCHGHEFLPQDGSSGFDQIMKNTDPALVKLEIDLYWLVQAGVEPAAFLKKYRDRIRLLHVKDRVSGAPTSYAEDATAEHFTELGKGSIPWRALLTQARQQGIRYVFLDQDKTQIPVLESLQKSFTYLQTLKL
jgi:sugar phosphate isomerase/epimerase